MKRLVSLLTAIMLSGAASAATFLAIPEDGVKVLVDTKASCTEASAAKVAAMKPPANIHWMGAVVDVHGEKLAACAAEVPGRILLVYEDGDVGVIPTEMFHLVHEV
jgi:hypothetical protein